jgi:uncharacterized protein (DUF4415 family)
MQPKPLSGRSDWIDPDDAPELTDEFFDVAEITSGGTVIRRGRPPSGQTKQSISLRLDRDVLAGLRALGPGWQTRVNEALRAFLNRGPSRS